MRLSFFFGTFGVRGRADLPPDVFWKPLAAGGVLPVTDQLLRRAAFGFGEGVGNVRSLSG